MIFLQVEFPYRHDLDALRNLLPDGWLTKKNLLDLAGLSQWAVEASYPGDWQEATKEDARAATEQARKVYETVLEDLERRGYAPEDTA